MVSAAENLKALKRTRSLCELLPWAVALTPRLVLCKDGALLGGFTYQGMDTEGRGESELAGDAALLERALGAIASRRLMLWWVVRRDRVNGWTGGTFTDPVTARADAAARREWSRRNHYINQRTLWVALAPPTPTETLLGRVAEEGTRGLASGVLPWLRASLTGHALFESQARRLAARVDEAEALMGRLTALFPDMRLSRLVGPSLFGWLNTLASPTVAPHSSDVRTAIQALDEVLGEDTLEQDGAGMVFAGPQRSSYVAALSPKTVPEAWPETFHPGILDRVIDIDCECVFSLAVRFMDTEGARSAVRERRRHLLNWRKGMGGHVREGLLKVESEQADSEKEIQATEADQALRDLVHTPASGWMLPVFYVRADSPERRERALAEGIRAFHIAGFNVLRERMHQVSAWAGTLPGQWAAPVRWTYASAAAIADLSPLRGVSRGSAINRHLSKQCGTRLPALAAFPTRSLEPYWLEPHLADVGHGLILGPTGAGKTVIGGWMALRWSQYPRSRTYVFDKDRSLRKMVLLSGGEYLDEQGGLRVNPFHGLEGDADWNWAVDFVVSLLTPTGGEELPAADVNEIATACRHVRALPGSDRRLRSLMALLPSRLRERLAQWVGEGRYAAYFDHAEDGMRFGTTVGVAMDEVLRFAPAARAFMDLAFHRIRKHLDGSPTYIHIEEGWFLLAEERFAAKLDDWSRTLRKLNGLLMVSTQALGELAESKAFSGLAAAPNRFLLPNRDIYTFESLYRDQLGLTQEQIRMIAEARPKGEVVLVRDGRARVLEATLPAEALALMRADARADEAFERWRESGHEQWRMRYVDEMSESDRDG